ncbi:phosphoribosylformylglycinamidine cyclo-ligase [Gemmatimonadota bacterium]
MINYESSGVNLQAADSIKAQISRLVSSTYTDSVITKGNEFAGIIRLEGTNEAIAVSVDGVGTKLLVAIRMGVHNTVGEDLVNHCVNDIAVTGCNPLCFVDYISIGNVDEHVILELIDGLSRGCINNGVALVGGETAQMPDIYKEGEYDLAGAIVGSVNPSDQLPRTDIKPGDVLVGKRSSGLHTNGYSLVRKIVFELNNWDVSTHCDDFGHTWGEELLAVHRSYLGFIKQYRSSSGMKGFAHITGGGIPGNLSRILPEDVTAVVFKQTIPEVPIFHVLQDAGAIDEEEMFRVFNMGVGLIAVCSDTLAEEIVASAGNHSDTWILGEIVSRDESSAAVKLE